MLLPKIILKELGEAVLRILKRIFNDESSGKQAKDQQEPNQQCIPNIPPILSNPTLVNIPENIMEGAEVIVRRDIIVAELVKLPSGSYVWNNYIQSSAIVNEIVKSDKTNA